MFESGIPSVLSPKRDVGTPDDFAGEGPAVLLRCCCTQRIVNRLRIVSLRLPSPRIRC